MCLADDGLAECTVCQPIICCGTQASKQAGKQPAMRMLAHRALTSDIFSSSLDCHCSFRLLSVSSATSARARAAASRARSRSSSSFLTCIEQRCTALFMCMHAQGRMLRAECATEPGSHLPFVGIFAITVLHLFSIYYLPRPGVYLNAILHRYFQQF